VNPSAVLAARSNGDLLRDAKANGGRVFVIGREPIVDLVRTNPTRLVLVLYGIPGSGYRVESASNLVTSAWATEAEIELNGPSRLIDTFDAIDPIRLYRAVEVAGPPVSISQTANSVVIQWAATCPNCVLEESSILGEWTRPSVPITTIGSRRQVTIVQPAGNRFYRLYVP
jgi:hypothetical protein